MAKSHGQVGAEMLGYNQRQPNGFTLIEMSIVLVIIGLLVGGVLTGRDLVRAAEVRAQISQIADYNVAVNTFREKYGAIPGDLNAATASTFGFTPRGQYAGEGDGNGILEGVAGDSAGANLGSYQAAGETCMFWVDLTTANGLNVNLIPGGFSTCSPHIVASNIAGTLLNAYLPQAKIGRGNYVYVYSANGLNFYGISEVIDLNNYTEPSTGVSIPTQLAFAIDKKMDDGYPQTGNVIAKYLTAFGPFDWAGAPGTGATPGTPTSCYDNGGVAGAPQHYSIEVNGGAGANCALSFQFQ